MMKLNDVFTFAAGRKRQQASETRSVYRRGGGRVLLKISMWWEPPLVSFLGATPVGTFGGSGAKQH